MYLLFVDESGKPSDKTFAVGGIAVRANEWPVLRDRWLGALDAYGWPADKELKWHGTRTGEVPPALADAVFEAIAAAPITCFVVIIRALAARQRRPDLFASDEDVYAQALMYLAERYQRFLARQDAYGTRILDRRLEHLDGRIRRFFERLQKQGTPYLRLERLVDAVLLGPSQHSFGLQVADLVVASARSAQGAPGDASRWHKQLLPRFARHPDSGELDGVGLVVYPRKPKGEEPPPASCSRRGDGAAR